MHYRWIVFSFLLAVGAVAARAESYPEKPIKLIVGFGQGGPTDVIARVLAEELSLSIGQRVYVENRPGASGNIATQAAVSIGPDGYSYLIAASPLAFNHTLFPDFPVKFGKDIVAIASIGATSNVLVVSPSLKISTLAEFQAVARTSAANINYVTLGRGSSSHIAGVEFSKRAGVALTPVPYKGNGDAVQDIVGGHVNAWFATIPSVSELVRGGQLRALAVTGSARSPMMPDVPTISELLLPGFDVRLWIGLFAAAEIPADRRLIMERAVAKAMASPSFARALSNQGIEELRMGREEFTHFVNAEIGRGAQLAEFLK